MREKKTLPIGIDDYKEACLKNVYLVDKSLLIKDIIDSGAEAFFIMRPRYFGKTLNMSMLQTFFENTGKDTSFYFKDKKYGK